MVTAVSIAPPPILQFLDNNGRPCVGGSVLTQVGGVNAAVYQDSSGTVPLPNPIPLNNRGEISNATGVSCQLFLDNSEVYTFTLFDANGNQLNQAQYVAPSAQAANTLQVLLADSTSVANGDALVAVKNTATGAVATTQHQVNEEDASVFRFMTPAQISAIESEIGASGAVCSAALQAALDGVRTGSTLGLNRYPVGTFQLDAPLRIKNGTPRMAIRGDNRIRTVFQPNAVDIKQAPINVNALIINQDNNPLFCLENIRMTATNGYTGIGIYSVEGGGADASCQCLFSGIFRNLWVDFGTTNSGFLTGASQNCIWDTMTFENMKGVFNLQGAGNGDNFYTNISLASCYDQFILQTTDTNGSFAQTVRSVHAYMHQRGLLFDVQNWIGGTIDDVYFEAAAGNLGSTGIGRFTNCTGTLLSNLYALARAGVPACAIGLEFDTFSGKVQQGTINGDIGIRLSGTGAMSLDIVNVDFTNCTTACLQFFGNFSGTIRTTRCKFNSSQASCAVFQVAASCDWYSTDDEFLDAGLGGNVATRNLSLTTSGNVVMTRPKIGRTTGSALAQYWIDASGSGKVDIYDPIFIGSPPSGIVNPANTQVVNIHNTPATGMTRVTAAAYTVLDSDRDIIVSFAGICTLTLPAAGSSGAYFGRRINIRTVTANTVVSASANVCPSTSLTPGTPILAATAGKGAELVYDLTNSVWQNQLSN